MESTGPLILVRCAIYYVPWCIVRNMQISHFQVEIPESRPQSSIWF